MIGLSGGCRGKKEERKGSTYIEFAVLVVVEVVGVVGVVEVVEVVEMVEVVVVLLITCFQKPLVSLLPAHQSLRAHAGTQSAGRRTQEQQHAGVCKHNIHSYLYTYIHACSTTHLI